MLIDKSPRLNSWKPHVNIVISARFKNVHMNTAFTMKHKESLILENIIMDTSIDKLYTYFGIL